MYHLTYFANTGQQHTFNSPTPFPAFAAGQHVMIGGHPWNVQGVQQAIDETPGGLEFTTTVYLGPIAPLAALHGGGGGGTVPWPW